MIHVELCFNTWTPWRKPYYVMDDRKFPVYSYSRPYWFLNDKLYFGTYQSIFHWEIKLYVADGHFRDADMKNIRGRVDSFPHRQLLYGGSAIPKWKWYLPEREEVIELATTIEKKWKSQMVHYFWENEYVGKIVDLTWNGLFSGKVAKIFVEPQYEMLLPHFLGVALLTKLSW